MLTLTMPDPLALSPPSAAPSTPIPAVAGVATPPFSPTLTALLASASMPVTPAAAQPPVAAPGKALPLTGDMLPVMRAMDSSVEVPAAEIDDHAAPTAEMEGEQGDDDDPAVEPALAWLLPPPAPALRAVPIPTLLNPTPVSDRVVDAANSTQAPGEQGDASSAPSTARRTTISPPILDRIVMPVSVGPVLPDYQAVDPQSPPIAAGCHPATGSPVVADRVPITASQPPGDVRPIAPAGSDPQTGSANIALVQRPAPPSATPVTDVRLLKRGTPLPVNPVESPANSGPGAVAAAPAMTPTAPPVPIANTALPLVGAAFEPSAEPSVQRVAALSRPIVAPDPAAVRSIPSAGAPAPSERTMPRPAGAALEPITQAAAALPLRPPVAPDAAAIVARGGGEPVAFAMRPAPISSPPFFDERAFVPAFGAPSLQHAPGAATVATTGGSQQAGIDLTRDPGLHRMIDRIEQLRDAANANDTRIRLIPDALGPVEVSVRRDGDAVQVRFTAQQEATRQLIAEATPRLAELAEARGVRIDRTSVEGGPGHQGAHHWGDQSRQFAWRQPDQPGRPVSAATMQHDGEVSDQRIA